MARTAILERPNCPLYNDQKLKLGLFGTNCSNGLTVSHAETTYRATWEHSLAIARHAEAMGFEMLVPIARWRGFGGTTDFNGTCFETNTWAAGLAAATERIMVFSTSHVPTVHPIVAAKQSVTVDHISRGRFGLNLVMGWFTPEMEMFGAPQREHDERYAFGAEWLRIVKRLWTEEEPFDLEGKYFRISQGQAHPKPLQKPYPVLVNAGNSPAGLEFSAREVDFNFLTLDTIEHGREVIADLRRRAHGYRREIGAMTYAMMICRDNEREALEVRREILDKGDWGAATNIMKVLGIESGSFQEQIRSFGERFILGWGGYPIVGTPEQAVDQLKTISAMGIEGVILGFLDYHEELAYFERAVMPLLKQVGLRR
ncbi:MAG TPA: LLM class flavin-dependent oxidoreductase [Candidatus Binataceae bacterium]|nr:LLM class flavin-dependent oxidoreductase [Candidatus Binataceae bacterium]